MFKFRLALPFLAAPRTSSRHHQQYSSHRSIEQYSTHISSPKGSTESFGDKYLYRGKTTYVLALRLRLIGNRAGYPSSVNILRRQITYKFIAIYHVVVFV